MQGFFIISSLCIVYHSFFFFFLWNISNPSLEIIISVSHMQWKNLHKNRSCHPLFLCQASSLSKENGTTHRFSPDWEQETADLGLCVCFCRTIWQTLWQWWCWCIMWMLQTSASIVAVLQLSWGMGVGLKWNKSSLGIGLSRLEEC